MKRERQQRQRGVAVFFMAAAMMMLIGLAGLGTDLTLAYLAKVRLGLAVDAALLSAARASSEDTDAVAQNVFSANYPSGYLVTLSRSMSNPTLDDDELSSDGTATIRTYFMRLFGYSTLQLSHAAKVKKPSGAFFLIMDEDSLDNGVEAIEDISFSSPWCGGGDSSVCVNDDIADPYVRNHLFTRGGDITPYSGLSIPTGQTGDEGLFLFSNDDPQVSLQNSAQFTTQEFIDSTGAAADENNLDKISGVVPLDAADITDLVGLKVCAVVFDSDVSTDVPAGYGVLKGATTGLTAYEVTGTVADPGGELPWITVSLVPSSEVAETCDGASSQSPPGGGGAIYLMQ